MVYLNTMILLLVSYFGWYTVIAGDQCSPLRRRRCRYGVLEELEADVKAMSTHELEFHCKFLRDNLECLVWQISQCDEDDQVRERNGDVMHRAMKHTKSTCSTFGGWWDNSCFQSSDARACNRYFVGGDTRSTCTEYERFRVCISDVIENRCDEERGDAYFGTYLLDRAGDMVWKCSRQQDSEKVLTSRSLEVKNATSVRLLTQDSHLHSSFQSAPIVGDPPFVTGCNARANEEMKGCLDRHQFERDQALGAGESEDRLRKTCCARWKYRRCLQSAVRTHCYDTREVDIQSAVDVIPHERDYLCRDHWVYTCSGSAGLSGTVAILLISWLSCKLATIV